MTRLHCIVKLYGRTTLGSFLRSWCQDQLQMLQRHRLLVLVVHHKNHSVLHQGNTSSKCRDDFCGEYLGPDGREILACHNEMGQYRTRIWRRPSLAMCGLPNQHSGFNWSDLSNYPSSPCADHVSVLTVTLLGKFTLRC